MKIDPLGLDGAFRISFDRFEDGRGSFQRLSCARALQAVGLTTDWVQTNVSRTTHKGSLRGLHYQNAPFEETKLITCLTGRVFDVLVDLRHGSRSFGQWVAVELDGATSDTIYVPPGVAHGFQTLTDGVTLHYSHSSAFAPDHQAGLLWCDPQVAIAWPSAPTVMSERDRALPRLDEILETCP